jgi:hypothetical protein
MQRILICLTGLLLLATSVRAYGQSRVACPIAPEERSQRCAHVSEEIATHQRAIESAEHQLRNPAIILARVEKLPDESVADYRNRVRRQQGVATPQSNIWLPVQGHYYNPDQRQMYVALEREAYWHYLWEGLASDPELAEATFKRREQQSRSEKSFQLENPDSAANRQRYRLESLLAFQRECCNAPNPQATSAPSVSDVPENPLAAPPPAAARPASEQP